MSRIDRYLDDWLDALGREESQGKFAQKIGRSHAVFQKARLGRGQHGFNPTYQLLKDAEPFLNIAVKPTLKKVRNVEGNVHSKAYLSLLSGLNLDDALYSAHSYLEYLRAENHRLREADVDFALLERFSDRAVGGDISVHLVNFDPEFGRSSFAHWDAVADYRNGRDFTGALIAELGDEGLTACLQEDFEDIASTGWPQITALRRHHTWQAETKASDGRSFLRYMCRLEGIDGRPKILAMRSLQVGTSARQLAKSVFA
jgi:hypothetical protein